MARELEKHQLVERSVIKKFRKSIWNPFIECVKGYSLISPDDIIGIKLYNCAESILCIKLMQQLKRVSDFDFELCITACDDTIINIAQELVIPLSEEAEQCTKYADFICFDDVNEKTVASMLFEHKTESITPMRINEGKEIISPLYCIERSSIYAFSKYNGLDFTYNPPYDDVLNKAQNIIEQLKSKNEGIEHSIFRSVHGVCLDTLLGYETNSKKHSFLDKY